MTEKEKVSTPPELSFIKSAAQRQKFQRSAPDGAPVKKQDRALGKGSWSKNPLGHTGRSVSLLGMRLVEIVRPLCGQRTQGVPSGHNIHLYRNKTPTENSKPWRQLYLGIYYKP